MATCNISGGTSRKMSFGLMLIILISFAISGCEKTEEVAPEQIEPPDVTEEEMNSVNVTIEEFDSSVEGIEELLAEDPDSPDLIFMLMSARLDAGDYTGALGLLEPLSEAGDRYWLAQGHMLAGRIFRDNMLPGTEGKDHDDMLARAAMQFEAAIKLDRTTNISPAYLYLGQVQQEMGDFDNAISNLSIYVALYPHHYDARLSLAETYIASGDKTRASFLLEEMKSDPNDARREKAMALLEELDKDQTLVYWLSLGLICVIIVGVAIYVMRKGDRAKAA